MEITDQICAFDFAKRLKELGVKQDSLFYRFGMKDYQYIFCKTYEQYSEHVDLDIKDGYAAFTSEELLSILPNAVTLPTGEPFDNFRLGIKKFISVDEHGIQTNNFIINYYCDTTEVGGDNAFLCRQLTSNIYHPVLANAAAEMLIYLIESGLMPA